MEGGVGPSHLGVRVHAVDQVVHLRVLLLAVAFVGLQKQKGQRHDEERHPEQEHRQEEACVHQSPGQGLSGDHQVRALRAERAQG